MAHTETEIKAFVARCQALVADGDDQEFQWRMQIIIRWWLGQALHSCAGDQALLMKILTDAVEGIGIRTEVVVVSPPDQKH